MSNEFIKRETILNGINYKKNQFCNIEHLTNEASVETFFVNRMLANFGYDDHCIKTKESIETFLTAKGSKKINYKPDYVILFNKKPVLVIDAKSPKENIDSWKEQCAHYCLIMRRNGIKVKYFLLTNGISTKLYEWDKDTAILSLKFDDFFQGNPKYESLYNIICHANISKKKNRDNDKEKIKLNKISKEEAQKLFSSCHKLIWSQEKRSPNSAFIEFVKLIFVKLYNDKRIHDKYSSTNKDFILVPKEENIFSVNWIESRESETNNPINDIQFKKLMDNLQDEITKNHKKTIFYEGERIELKPTTIKAVVTKLEKIDLFGIDEDLNGRLFETFLNATMRGKDLGQFFTPRSVVLLGASIADLEVTETHIDKVLDGSCGSGGFLIEALTIMRNKIRDNGSYSTEQKVNLIKKISNECIFGIDAAIEPNLAKIARINMYLHGDGGSHIYCADGLDKNLTIDRAESPVAKAELLDMKKNIKESSFDIVLTNPPFSMWYDANDDMQKKIVRDYNLLKIDEETNKTRNRLRTSAMFLERYKDLLKPAGKLITVIDETILSSDDYLYVRDFIRNNFIIKAIISLHGDAFQMSKARVKTALVYLQKKKYLEEQQPACFMYSSVYLGVDDMPVTTAVNVVQEARINANNEVKKILDEFQKFQKGQKGDWYVEADKLTNRLDVKSCINTQGRYTEKWEKDGYKVFSIEKICNPIDENLQTIKPENVPNQEFKILTIGYDGKCRSDEIRLGKYINYRKMTVCKEGDLVFSNYNAFHGAVGYITKDFDGCLASGSYTVVKCPDTLMSIYLWSILRTTEIRADLLSSAVGMGRQTIGWNDIKKIKVPILGNRDMEMLVESITDAWNKEKEISKIYCDLKKTLHDNFNVESESSKLRFQQNKPPK